jgi:hypothetical protein
MKKRAPEAVMTASLFEIGIGDVIISRFKSDDSVESGIFLVDAFCLGVKDATHLRSDPFEYEHVILPQLFSGEPGERLPAACARKLVEQAVSYASAIGFAPARDYRKAARVFGGISVSDCASQFAFGFEGKPCFLRGPYDSIEKCHLVLSALEAHCGPGNFGFDLALDMEPEFGEEQIDNRN